MNIYVIKENSTGNFISGAKGQKIFSSVSGAKNSFYKSKTSRNIRDKLILATQSMSAAEEFARLKDIWDKNSYNYFVSVVGEEGLRKLQELYNLASKLYYSLSNDQRRLIEKSSRFNDSNYTIERVVDFVTEPVITK